MSRNRVLLILLCLFGLAAAGFASFTDTGMGARAAGLGNVFTAVANDSYAAFYNPAGPAIIRNACVGTTYGMYYGGLTDGTSIYEADLSFVIPAQSGGFGFYWQETGLRDYYSEDTIAAGYAMKVMPSLAAGAVLKLRSLGYAANIYSSVLSKLSVSAISADIGLLYNVAPGVNAGLAVADLLSPNLGIATANIIPATIRGGVAWYPFTGEESRDLLVTMDGYFGAGNFSVAAGGEYWLMPKVGCVRAGYSIGDDNLSIISGGLGFRTSQLIPGMSVQFDYSFELSMSFSDLGPNHRFSVNVVLDK